MIKGKVTSYILQLKSSVSSYKAFPTLDPQHSNKNPSFHSFWRQFNDSNIFSILSVFTFPFVELFLLDSTPRNAGPPPTPTLLRQLVRAAVWGSSSVTSSNVLPLW